LVLAKDSESLFLYNK